MSQSETKTMPEAVEYWLEKENSCDWIVWDINPNNAQAIHVISYSAYSALKAESERLTNEINIVRAELEKVPNLKDFAAFKNAALVAENSDFRAALESYADKWIFDAGKLARAVLSKHDKKDNKL